MSLETPNRIAASAVLLIEDFDAPGTTIEFASNNAFASVLFLEPGDPETGAVLAMDQPVNNQEGAVYVRPDLGADEDVRAFITPNHFVTGTPSIDNLAPFQVAITDFIGSAEVFRIGVTVFKMTEVLAQLQGEPVTP